MIAAFICATSAIGQLSGVYYIPTGSGTPAYATIQDAVNDLNSLGVSGTVTFKVSAGYTESVTVPILLSATGTSVNTITFQKEGQGLNPIITRTDAGSIATSAVDAQGDAVVIIEGADFVTFDGIDLASLNEGIEYGYYLRKASASDACKDVTITNAVVTMTKGTSPYVTCIYSSNNDPSSPANNANGVTVTSMDGRTENLRIVGNTVKNAHAGIKLRGYNHTNAPYQLLDRNNIIGESGAGNLVQNFGGGSSAQMCHGIYVIYQTSPNISYNIIDNTAGGGSPAISQINGIYVNGTVGGGNLVINNNDIKLSQSATSAVYSIIQNAVNCTSMEINDNTFRFGLFNSTSASYMIYASSGTNDVTVTGNSNTPFSKGASGNLYGYYCNPVSPLPTGGTASISDFNFSNITMTGGNFWGIQHSAGQNQLTIISGNKISGFANSGGNNIGILQGRGAAGSSVDNNIIENWSGGGNFTGISAGNPASPGVSVFKNFVRGMTTTNTGASLYIYGILSTFGSTCNMYQNSIYNLEANNSNGTVYGIYAGSAFGTITHNIYNNFISDLRTPITNAAINLAGIAVLYGTTANVFYNTVYLNATSTGALFGSAALYAAGSATNPILDLRNNILVNLSVPNGTGVTAAYRRTNSILTNYSLNSNANCFYAGPVEDATHTVFFDGTTAYDIASYKTLVGPARDASSFREMPPFVNIVATPFNIHIMNSTPTLCEGGALPVTSPIVIADDYDGDLRSATTPDVGADEFGTTPVLDLSAFVTNNLCNGAAAGAIDLTVTGGIPPYAFIWSTGATSEDISSLAAGTYSVTVTDAVSGTITGSWAVTEPDAISLTASTKPASCPGAADGKVDLTVSGGTPGFTFIWSNGATTQNISGVTAGVYQVTVTDQNNCVITGSWAVPVNSPVCPDITVSGTIDTTACFNATDTIIVAGNGQTFTVTATGTAYFIAGSTILFLPGTTVLEGGSLSAVITSPTGPFCETLPLMATPVSTGQEEWSSVDNRNNFIIYPNPVQESFTLAHNGKRQFNKVWVEVYSLNGTCVLKECIQGEVNHGFSVDRMPSGLYFVKVAARDHVETLKLVKL